MAGGRGGGGGVAAILPGIQRDEDDRWFDAMSWLELSLAWSSPFLRRVRYDDAGGITDEGGATAELVLVEARDVSIGKARRKSGGEKP